MSTATIRSFREELLPSASLRASRSPAAARSRQNQAPPAPEVTVQTVDSQPVPLESDLHRAHRRFARGRGACARRRHRAQAPLPGRQPRRAGPADVPDRSGARACARGARRAPKLPSPRRAWTKRVVSAIACCRCSRRTRSARAGATKRCRASKSRRRTCRRPSRSCAWRSSISEYTDVRAPISGLTSREVLSEGSLVSTDQASSLLTKIVQVDPLYVEFAVPEAEAAMIRGGLAPANKSAPPPGVKLILENGSEYPQAAQVDVRRQRRGHATRAPCACAPCCRTRTRS